MQPDESLPGFDLYAELGVADDADPAAVRAAWRRAVATEHPDIARRGDDATSRTARLNIARDWLSDPVRKARYDELRRPRSDASAPIIDPLGPWPERDEPPAPLPMLGAIAMLSVVILVVLAMAGIGTNVVTVGLFALTLVIGGFAGLVWLFGILSPPR